MPPDAGALAHIDDVSRAIATRLGAICPDCEIKYVSNDRVSEDVVPAKPEIELCFRTIAAEKPDRATRQKADSYLVFYDVYVRGPEPLENQRNFSAIFFSEEQDDDFRVIIPSAAEESKAAGGECLTVTARLVRSTEPYGSHIVTSPLKLKIRELNALRGQIVSESGAPVMNATIEARALNKRVQSTWDGRFMLPGAPADGALSLSIRARSKTIAVVVDVKKQSEVVIVMPMEEEHA